jgi:hypothetical protein
MGVLRNVRNLYEQTVLGFGPNSLGIWESPNTYLVLGVVQPEQIRQVFLR